MAYLQDPASSAFEITPNDGSDLPRQTRGIYVGSDGDLHVLMSDGPEVTFKNMSYGMTYGLRLQKIFATGTTATDLVGLL